MQAYDTDQIFEKLNAPRWQIRGNFRGRDLISVVQLDKHSIRRVLDTADELHDLPHRLRSQVLAGKSIAVLFYQPSTRTYTSFIQAGQKMGADVMGIHGMTNYSSAYKGETLADTVRTVQALDADCVILRHFDDDSAFVAASHTNIPIINAGSGKLEHPTQALLDVRTIMKELDRDDPENAHIAFIGDLKFGRTVHSLAELMAIMGAPYMSFVSPDVLKMPRNLIEKLEQRGVKCYETTDINDVIGEADVLYVTRVQREWFESDEEYETARVGQQITSDLMKKVRSDAILMHPLPRVDEILPEVDEDPRAVYFKQVRHGLFTRMAILKLVLYDYEDVT